MTIYEKLYEVYGIAGRWRLGSVFLETLQGAEIHAFLKREEIEEARVGFFNNKKIETATVYAVHLPSHQIKKRWSMVEYGKWIVETDVPRDPLHVRWLPQC